MPTPAAIVEELDALLDAPSFGDWCLNGLQVPGEREVQRVVTGVSANHALLEAAAASGADLVLVHHGLFWGAGVRAIDPVLHQRLALLYGSGIALAAYHLPLDADPVFGNNALLARALGATPAGMFAPSFEKPIGVVAELGSGGPRSARLKTVGAACARASDARPRPRRDHPRRDPDAAPVPMRSMMPRARAPRR